MPIWVGMIHVPGAGGGSHIRFREEIDGVSAFQAKRIIENKYSGEISGLPYIDSRRQESLKPQDISFPAPSFGSSGRQTVSRGTSDSDAIGASLDALGDLALLGAKGAWKLGKFGIRKFKENRDEHAKAAEKSIEIRLNKFLSNPRLYDVKWKFTTAGKEFDLDGRQTLAVLDVPSVMSRYIDDALDEFTATPNSTSYWKQLLITCTAVSSDIVDSFPGNLFIKEDEHAAEICAPKILPGDLFEIITIYVRLLERDAATLGQECLQLMKRLRGIAEFAGSTEELNANYIELPPTLLSGKHFDSTYDSNAAYGKTSDPSDGIHVENNYNSDETYLVDVLHNSEDLDGQLTDNACGSPDYRDNLSAQASEIVETSTYGCIWYEKEGFSFTPNPEGTLVISENKIFFVESDMDFAGFLAIVNNQVDDDGSVRWIFSPEAVSSITKSKVSFRSAYTLNTNSGGSYKMVFMPGKGESVIAKLRKLGIKTSF
jgi:hypothetical protein